MGGVVTALKNIITGGGPFLSINCSSAECCNREIETSETSSETSSTTAECDRQSVINDENEDDVTYMLSQNKNEVKQNKPT